jgi:peroxiredoxin
MLAVGDRAPEFSAAGTDGPVEFYRLLDDGPTVLYFFPRAMTPG